MDDSLVHDLGRSLYRLSRFGPFLDDLMLPRQAASGENAGKPPSKGKSKPPVVVSMMDLKAEAQWLLSMWCGALVSSCPEVGCVPADRAIAVRAEWLREHLLVVESMPWARRCAEQVIAQERMISDVVAPPVGKEDPEPIEMGTIREIIGWARHLGRPVSRTTVQRWVACGMIPSERTPDGRVLVRLSDVLDQVPLSAKLVVGHPSS